MTFESWAAAQLPALLGAARAMCGDRGTAEDVVQDVLTKVYAHWDRIETLDSPDAYVRRMLVNDITSWRRKWADAASPTSHALSRRVERWPSRSCFRLPAQRGGDFATDGFSATGRHA